MKTMRTRAVWRSLAASTTSSILASSSGSLPASPHFWARNLAMVMDWPRVAPSYSSRGSCPYGSEGLRRSSSPSVFNSRLS